MREFRFEHLRNRSRLRLPRPVLYVGAAIILLAFFSIKWVQRTPATFPTAPESGAVEDVPVPAAGPDPVLAPAPASVPVPEEGASEGILSLDGTGHRIQPPRRISGQRPEIPAAMLHGRSLENPRVYVRVGADGLVAALKLVTSSGSEEVDRLVLDALGQYTFHPAMSVGRPVAFSSVISVPLHAPADDPS